MDVRRKENIQYTTAIIFLFTGIIMCFLSFFLNEYDIRTGALTYLGESVAFSSGVFAINLYVKNKVSEAETRINDRIERRIKEEETRYREENETTGEDVASELHS